MNKITLALAAVSAASLLGTSASAGFVATGTGPITAYFYSTDAGFNSEIGLLINGVSTGIYGLPNHASSHGDSLVLGNAVAGDSLTFVLHVLTTGNYFYSDVALNADGFAHALSAPFAGDSSIPAGTWIGFEDIFGGGDQDFNDHQFVFTGVHGSTPDSGSTLALGGLGLLALGALRRKLA